MKEYVLTIINEESQVDATGKHFEEAKAKLLAHPELHTVLENYLVEQVSELSEEDMLEDEAGGVTHLSNGLMVELNIYTETKEAL